MGGGVSQEGHLGGGQRGSAEVHVGVEWSTKRYSTVRMVGGGMVGVKM